MDCVQNAELTTFLSANGFGSPPAVTAAAEQGLPPAALQQCRAIVARVLRVCIRLANVDADTEELATSTFDACAPASRTWE